MLISYNWLQKYFDKPLPAPKDLAEIITAGVFEIDALEEVSIPNAGSVLKDYVLDVKVLPDRSCYANSYRYIAQEVGALIGQKVTSAFHGEVDVLKSGLSNQDFSKEVPADSSLKVQIKVQDEIKKQNLCPRYLGRRAIGVANTESPVWLKVSLEAIGQRSISLIVDIANYVMLETGQPLHAFDADKLEGDIQVRFARSGEEIELLDGKIAKLDESMMVIADDVSALAIAGIKGGKKAEVTLDTKNIVIESANFDRVSIRKTSQAVGIQNDSSKRYENNVTPERTEMAMKEASLMLQTLIPSIKFGDIYDTNPDWEKTYERVKEIEVGIDYINDYIGLEGANRLSEEKIKEILNSCGLDCGLNSESAAPDATGNKIKVNIPIYRRDLNIKEDIVEEVCRLNGTDKVPATPLPAVSERPILKTLFYTNLIKEVMRELGYTEIMTYTLVQSGDWVLANPLNIERGALRNDLSSSLEKKLEHNLKYADLLCVDEIRLFEIGNVFKDKIEKTHFAFGVSLNKKVKGYNFDDEVTALMSSLAIKLGMGIVDLLNKNKVSITTNKDGVQGGVVEFNLSEIISGLSEPRCYSDNLSVDVLDKVPEVPFAAIPDVKYKKYSVYPYMIRDIAVFLPCDESGVEDGKQKVEKIIRDGATDLLVNLKLFDIYTKKPKNPESNNESEPVKTSFAYRLVFQSMERTLTVEEIDQIMQEITRAMNANENWEVR